MKVVRATDPGTNDALRVSEEAIPELGRRDVLIKMGAASLNFRDLLIATAQYPAPFIAMVRSVDGIACSGEEWLGSPQHFSVSAIEFCLTLKGLFGLALRQVTELVASLLKLAKLDWPVPDYTTFCRRQKT